MNLPEAAATLSLVVGLHDGQRTTVLGSWSLRAVCGRHGRCATCRHRSGFQKAGCTASSAVSLRDAIRGKSSRPLLIVGPTDGLVSMRSSNAIIFCQSVKMLDVLVTGQVDGHDPAVPWRSRTGVAPAMVMSRKAGVTESGGDGRSHGAKNLASGLTRSRRYVRT